MPRLILNYNNPNDGHPELHRVRAHVNQIYENFMSPAEAKAHLAKFTEFDLKMDSIPVRKSFNF